MSMVREQPNGFTLADYMPIAAILPFSLHPSFELETPSAHVSSLSSVVSTYLHRASHSFASIFPSREIALLEDVKALASFFDMGQEPAFAAVDLARLHAIGQSHGKTSEAYTQVADKLLTLLEELVQDDRYRVAVLTYAALSPVSLNKRQTPQQTQAPLPSTAPPQQPIGSVSTCFASADKCSNETSSCSGRGKCVEASKAGKTCFVCSCGVSTTGEGNKVKTTYWAGESCERKDVSGYVLFTLWSHTY